MIILLLDNLCCLLDIFMFFVVFVHTQDIYLSIFPILIFEPNIKSFSYSSKPRCQRSSFYCIQNSRIADDHMPTLLLPAFEDLASNPVCVIQWSISPVLYFLCRRITQNVEQEFHYFHIYRHSYRKWMN